MNIVLDEAFEEKPGGEKVAIGMIVSCTRHPRPLSRSPLFMLDGCCETNHMYALFVGHSRQLSCHA